MGCVGGVACIILFVVNFVLAMVGLSVMATGLVTAFSQGATINNVLQSHLTTPAVLLAILGACIFLFAFFGCCGASVESDCMICTYAVLLLILLLLQVAVAVLAYTYKGQTKEMIVQQLVDRYEKYKEKDTKVFIDSLQQQAKCCGSLDTATPWDELKIKPPPSCYPDKDPSKGAMYATGCIPTLVTMVEDQLSLLAKVAIVVAVVQVVGILISCYLACSIRQREERRSSADYYA